MIGKFHASAQLGGEKGIRQIDRIDVWARRAQIIANVLLAADGREEKVWIGRQFLQTAPPESVGVSAEHREDVARRNDRIVPSGDRVERSVQAGFAGQFAQFENVVRTFSRTARAVFIFDLNADDRPAILPKKPLYLLADFAIEATYGLKVNRIVFPCGRLLNHPIRNPPVPHLAVIPRSYPNPDVEVIFP